MTVTTEDSTARADRDESTSLMWWVRTTGGWLLFIACGFILLALVVVPRATGAQAYTVLTGSMEPRIAPGALVVVRPTAPENLAAGDVITFQPYSGDPSVVTHRITDIYYDMSGQRRIYTRGDANNVADDWALVPEQIRGKLWYSVPQLGRVNVLLTGKTRAVAITIVAGSLIVYAAWVFGSGVRDRSREKQSALIVDRARSDEDAQVSHGAVVGNDEQQEGAGHDDSA